MKPYHWLFLWCALHVAGDPTAPATFVNPSGEEDWGTPICTHAWDGVAFIDSAIEVLPMGSSPPTITHPPPLVHSSWGHRTICHCYGARYKTGLSEATFFSASIQFGFAVDNSLLSLPVSCCACTPNLQVTGWLTRLASTASIFRSILYPIFSLSMSPSPSSLPNYSVLAHF